MILQRGLCIFVCWLLGSCSSVGPIDSIMNSVVDKASLDKALARAVETGVVPGISVVVVKNGAPVYMKGIGHADAEKTQLIESDTGFNLWSVSKVFTALAVLDLASEGKIGLDDSVCDYISWIHKQQCSTQFESRQTATIRMLLNHTAGIPELGLKLYGETRFEGDAIVDQQQLAQQLLAAPQKWSVASENSRYSNSNYLLLAAIVEAVAEQPFATYMQHRVLDPLELSATGYRYSSEAPLLSGSHPVDLMSFFAFFYVNKQRAVLVKKGGRYWFNPVYNSSLGSTGLVSNSADMATFMVAMLDCLRGDNSAIARGSCDSIRGSKAIDVSQSPARGVANLSQRLGWFVTPTNNGISFAHGGNGMGFTSMLQLFPEQDQAVFVIANDSYFDRRGGLLVANKIANLAW